MRIKIATSLGTFRAIDADETLAPGVVMHKSFGDSQTWTLTRRWTGFCFVNKLPSRRHATTIAAILGAVANWVVRTMSGIMVVYRALPDYWKAWLKELKKTLCTSSTNDPRAVDKALRQLRNRERRPHTGAQA